MYAWKADKKSVITLFLGSIVYGEGDPGLVAYTSLEGMTT